MKTLSLTRYMSEEIQHKLGIICDSEELQEEYGITEDEVYAIFKSVPIKGEWEVSDEILKILRVEMYDYPTFIRQLDILESVSPAGKIFLERAGHLPQFLPHITFQFNDGGRAEAGFKGFAGDCVCRAIAIAADLPYKEVYKALAEGNATERKTRRTAKSSGKRSARNGISTTRKWFKDYMESLGFKWVATMGIATGCKVHLREDELPSGRLVVALSKHYAAVVDGVLNDTYDSSRDGTRCVYGYWIKE